MAGEFRRDPLTGAWVNIVGNRQNRPNLPTTGCPFCVGGIESPQAYDVKAFANRWPAYAPGDPVDVAQLEATGIERFDAVGAAEVVLYSPTHDGSLGSLGVTQVRKVIDVWAERTETLLARPEIEYVLVFESRGTEVGATIHHPHGQLYAFPFVPPAPAAAARRSVEHGCTVCADLEHERSDPTRIVTSVGAWTAWVPYASGYPYGVRIAPGNHVGSLFDLSDSERNDLAAILVDVLGRYDRLWADDPRRSEIFPYLMWWWQAPSHHDGEYHLILQFAPPQRSPGVARFIAAGEVGSGTLSNPVIPEDAAEVLRNT